MAELVDAHASGACGGNSMEVRVLFSAQYGIIWFRARVVKWYTRTLEVRMPKGVEVQVLSRAPAGSEQKLCRGRLAQLVRASGLHPEGRGFEPLIVHICEVIRYNTQICQASQGGHGACLKNTRLRFDSSAWHRYCTIPVVDLGNAQARGNSSVGRASPCQGEGRGSESRFPLR